MSLAIKGKDLERLCWAQITLLLILADRNGPQAVVPLLTELRLSTIKHGDPQTVAALHLFVGEMEAKCGNLRGAQRHAGVAQRILATSENIWLEAVAENLLLAVSILRSDVRSGLSHGLRALELADESGIASTRRACLGNLGNLYHVLGDFEVAIDFFGKALTACHRRVRRPMPPLTAWHEYDWIKVNSTNAPDCSNALVRPSESDTDRGLYAHRSAQLTRTQFSRVKDILLRLWMAPNWCSALPSSLETNSSGTRACWPKPSYCSALVGRWILCMRLNEAIVRLGSDSSDTLCSLRACPCDRASSELKDIRCCNNSLQPCKAVIHEGLPSAPGLQDLKRS